MKRIIFLNRFFLPDHSATSQILGSLAVFLAAAGRDVHVITSWQLYDNPAARLPAEEIVSGVNVHRVSSTQFGRSRLVGRGIDYLSFYSSLWRSMLAVAGRNDILIAMTDPPLVSLFAQHAAKRCGALLVNWLQDIYPEVAIQAGVPFLTGPIGQLISHLRDASLKAAIANVVVGERMAAQVLARGVSPATVHVIPNWSNDEEISPVSNAENPLRRAWGLEKKFVVGYSGNLGRAHEFHTVLAAAERLRNNPDIVFILIGGGYLVDELARSVKEQGLDRTFRFLPYQDKALLKQSLCVPDVHWISLKAEFEGLIVPSKFYGIAAAGRPMIAITAKDGEVARWIERHECGFVIEPGNADALVKTLIFLSTDAERRAAMGGRARAMLDAHFTRRHALERWRDLLDSVG